MLLLPRWSPKLPPKDPPRVSGCPPLAFLNSAISKLTTFQVYQRMAPCKPSQVKLLKTTELHWLCPGDSKLSSLSSWIHTKMPWSSWRFWVCRITWKRWIAVTVVRSQQPRGSSCVERPGGTWRKPISARASQREKWLEGVLVCFTCFYSVYCTVYSIYLSLLESVRVQGQCKFFWEVVGWVDLGWVSDAMKLPVLCCHRSKLFSRNDSDKHCRCFSYHSEGVEGAADLLEALSQSPLLEEVDLAGCFRIPAAAWQQLRGATWRNLKKANFKSCLAKREMVEGVLVFFTVCTVQICTVCNISLLESVRVQGQCKFFWEVVVWVDLGWVSDAMKLLVLCVLVVIGSKLFLRNDSDKHCRCFGYGCEGLEGAADLLGTLSQSPLLEEVDFHDCSLIPEAAWRRIPSGAWPKLRSSRGIPNNLVARLRGVALDWRLAGLKSMPVGGREKIWMIRMILAGHLMWPRHLCVLFALNNYRLCLGLRRNSSFHVFHVDWRSFFLAEYWKSYLATVKGIVLPNPHWNSDSRFQKCSLARHVEAVATSIAYRRIVVTPVCFMWSLSNFQAFPLKYDELVKLLERGGLIEEF